MQIINGYTVLAKTTKKGGEVLILAVREDGYSWSGFEYVTTFWFDGAKEWHGNGHYWHGLDRAVSDYKERGGNA